MCAVELGLPMFLGILGGTPARWAQYGYAYRDAWAKVGHPAILQMDVGGMPHAAFLESIELLGTKVLPQIRKELEQTKVARTVREDTERKTA